MRQRLTVCRRGPCGDDTSADPVAAARAAGLRHVDDTRPGIRRQATGKKMRQGKRFVPWFVYLDAHGRRIDDLETGERIRKLAIPPAWTDVWICPAGARAVHRDGAARLLPPRGTRRLLPRVVHRG